MERRELRLSDIESVRHIDGFPAGSTEDIISMSDAPFYTACPNPFVADFIRENGTLYEEASDEYQREPFAADVSEGKKDPIYNAHSYHTKVPYKAIMHYILHYTNPGDLIYDGFCGTGMTGVAAQMCGSSDAKLQMEFYGEGGKDNWGARKAVLSDLAPAATYIASLYNHTIDTNKFDADFHRILNKVLKECSWMYETTPERSEQASLFGSNKAHVVYTVWSDVFICPHCGEEVIFWDHGVDHETGGVKDSFKCPKCGLEMTKKGSKRAVTSIFDDQLGAVTQIGKQVPVLIAYEDSTGEHLKKPDDEDLALIEKIESLTIPYWVPVHKTPNGFNTEQPRRSHGINYVHQFFTKRSLYVIAALWDEIERCDTDKESKIALKAVITGVMMGVSKLQRFRLNSTFPNMLLSGTLYIGSMVREWNVLDWVQGKFKSIKRLKEKTAGFVGNACISTNSLTNTPIPDNSIDYIFTDPPFGGNLNYSELSCIWEAWLKVSTDNGDEAIINDVQKKGLVEYQALMTACFTEYYRVLKPNRWITIEFHNSKNSVWNAIQEALQRAGFIISDVRTLDKKQQSFKQVNFSSAVKQDLVISAYKPKDSLQRSFDLHAGSPETAWDFVRQHLANVPVVVDADRDGKIDIVAERQAFLLFDRMVAYHIMRGYSVPIDATEFYRGLDDRFLKRDNMYFLADQVNEYDTARATRDIQTIQFSLFVSDEKSAIGWLYQQLDANSGCGPQTYAELMPKFMQELKAVDKREKMPELMTILEENFLKDEKGRWYIPDLTKSGDIAKLREKNLLKEFQQYMESKGKLKVFRSEAIRAGFAMLWKEKNYAAIVAMAERLPEETIQEDSNLLMYYDISLSRV